METAYSRMNLSYDHQCWNIKRLACLSAQPPKPSSPRPREDPTKPTLEIQHYNSKPIQFIS
ncbi:hypothetical protein OUZ56_033419 [Daphnia magna]|uniref:Uncharacterized protein n=1 Tax=Daphnia magna TaxID=35525 RepID=A0ABQ9ZLG9_9CRUS|nr:hypothetical protein OUZ56_026338 [Daphnia magna]KAK4017713.1 hypothetical protein OUZ56_033419 [Daphnia magna]